jgi:CubicO group peptidase (beta-lactamase class C family)
MSSAADYLQFAQMLLNGGELNGKRLLSPRTVELMASNHVGDMFNGKLGRPAHGLGFGLIVQVVEDNVAAGLRVSNGSFGWDGAFGTQVWVNPKEKMITVIMIQTQVAQVQRDFENAVMQAIVE